MRIVCPSSTSEALLGLHSAPPRTTTVKEQRVELKRRNSARFREQRKQQAEDSRKKSEKKKKIQTRPTVTNNTTTRIYVGNLLPGTSSDLLKRIFSNFGTISSVIIRCSSGLAVNRVSVPRSQLSARDRQYATVHFHDGPSATKALTLNGMELNGVNIVVSISAADLPEAVRDLQERLVDRQRKQRMSEPGLGRRAPPLVRGDTEMDF